MTAEDKVEILELVRKSPLSVKETLGQLGIPRSTYYGWKERFQRCGVSGLQDKKPAPQAVWNRLTDQETRTVLEYAHQFPDRSVWEHLRGSAHRARPQRLHTLRCRDGVHRRRA